MLYHPPKTCRVSEEEQKTFLNSSSILRLAFVLKVKTKEKLCVQRALDDDDGVG